MAKGSLVIVGSGPGIGVTTAALFAKNGFTKIALLARNGSRLPSDAATVSKAAPSATVKTYQADTSDVEGLRAALAHAERDLGPPEVVHFNAARIAPSTIGEESVDSLTSDYKIMVAGLYVVVSWAQPHLVKLAQTDASARPSLFLSGGSIFRNPAPEVFGLSMQKAAQHNLLQSLSKVVGPQGVHVADVAIAGPVKDDDPVINAANIAGTFWTLHREDPSEWRFDVEVGSLEDFTVSRKK